MALTYEPIATQTLGSAASTYTFSSISGSYTDLVLIASAYGTAVNQNLYIRFNGDSGNNYSGTTLWGNGTSALSARVTSQSYFFMDRLGNGTGYGTGVAHIMNYSNTTTYKTTLVRYGYAGTDTEATAGLWMNTAAITSVTIGGGGTANIAAGSTFTLYGIKAA